MRIAVVYDCLFPWSTGGGERLYRAFAEHFAAAGHEVAYLTRKQWPPSSPPQVEGVTAVAITDAMELYDDNGRRRLLPAIRFAANLFTHLLAHRGTYDAILVSATPVVNVYAAGAALAGTRVVLLVDWLEVWRPAQWVEYLGQGAGRIAASLQRGAARISPMASCYSKLTAQRLRQEGFSGHLIRGPGLIDPRPVGEPAITAPSPPKVVFVGRHVADKRVETIPAAVAEARASIPELRATLLGDGATRSLVQAEVDRLGLRGVVSLPGFVPQDRLEAEVREATCLVNPSVREGYGLVVVESCAAGTPVVLVDSVDNAAVELVVPGVNGFIASSTSPADLAQAIVAVVRSGPALRQSAYDWYVRSSAVGTVDKTAGALLDALEVAFADRRRMAQRASGRLRSR